MKIPGTIPYALGCLVVRASALVMVFATITGLWAQSEIPPFNALVTDVPGILSPDKKSELEQKLRSVKLSTGTEIAVLIVNTLSGNSVEGYAQEVVRKWKIGEQNKDNGILLLISTQEHAIRIEVGRGLEGSVPDIIAGRIIRDQMVPLFKSGDFAGGISLGVQRLIELNSGEYKQQERPSPSEQMPAINVFWVLVVIGVIFAQVLKTSLGSTLGPLSAGIAMGIIGAFSIGFLWGIVILFLVPLFSSGNGRYISGPGSGGWGGGGFGGGGFGGGGSIHFGGGGSFSGGGASGRW